MILVLGMIVGHGGPPHGAAWEERLRLEILIGAREAQIVAQRRSTLLGR